MPSAKHISTMERATGLISSLLDIASSRDMPFHQLQWPHSKHHGATFVLLFSQFFLLTTQGVSLQEHKIASH